MLRRLHIQAGALITFRHNLPLEDLRRHLVLLNEIFARAGLDMLEFIKRGNIAFERVDDAFENAEIELLKLSRAFEDSKAQLAACSLKQTAWERRNPNAPWWRRFDRKRRPALANHRQQR
ncbi:hypothetical protein [Prosthecobacter sp.]|uniref:hypothetical protein n=1 Tax=Prosthecobacter sp. TaxID=1965333 RepID=UPI00378472A5